MLNIILLSSDFIACFGMQSVPLEFGNKSPKNPHVGKKYPKLGKYWPIWIEKQPVFGCKIGKIKSLLS